VFAVTALLVRIPARWRFSLSVCCLVVAAGALAIDRFSPVINGLLWLAPVTAIVGSALWGRTHQQWDHARLGGGLALLAVGLIAFVLGNVLWRTDHGAADAPETPAYWLLHSAWHVVGMLGAGRILQSARRLGDRPRATHTS
jgi:hypothetical protein